MASNALTERAATPTPIFSQASDGKRAGELAISPAVEQAVTEIKLAAQLALMMPRDEKAATAQLLESCEDPIFADEAIFSVPRGRKKDPSTGQWVDNYVEGFSIRFAEEFMRVWKHMRSTVTVVLDTEDERTLSISVWDCAANASHSDQVHIRKVVERSDAKGRDVLYERLNSYNKTVFGVRATDEEIQNLQAAKVSKSIRNLVMRLASSKAKRVCYERCEATLRKEVESNLPRARAALLTAFAGIGVTRDAIEKHLGRSADAFTAEEITTLQNVGKAIKAGETTWKDYTTPVVTDDEGNEAEAPPERRQPERGTTTAPTRTVRPSEAEHRGKAGAIKPAAEPLTLTPDSGADPEPNTSDLWPQIDDHLGVLTGGDMDQNRTYERAARKAVGVPEEGDLTAPQVKALCDELARAVEEMVR